MAPEYRDRTDDAVERLRQSSIVDDAPEGCSGEEIAEIAATAGVELPAAYELFLQRMGRSAGDFLRGDDLFYPDVLGLTADARELLAESDTESDLTDTDFVFAGHHDYVYLYFDTSEGDDPPVYRYGEGEDGPQRVFDAFSAWLEASVDDEVSLADE